MEEEVIEQLRELSQAVGLPLELPTENELVEVEEEILISIPYDLRTFLLQVSDVIYGSIEPVTVADPRLHTYLPEVAAQAWDAGMPREYIPICEYQGGYACISHEGKIAFWCDEGMGKEQWEDIWQWCRAVWLKS